VLSVGVVEEEPALVSLLRDIVEILFGRAWLLSRMIGFCNHGWMSRGFI
jgi:hypothetical protein